MKESPAVRYKVTAKGKGHFAFLGDPDFMRSDEERAEAARKREEMTLRDWAIQQLLAYMGQCSSGDTEGYESRDTLVSGMACSHDSLVRQEFPTGDPEATAETIKIFDYAHKNLDSLLTEMLSLGLVKIAEQKGARREAKKRPRITIINGLNQTIVTDEELRAMEGACTDEPEFLAAIREFKRHLGVPPPREDGK